MVFRRINNVFPMSSLRTELDRAFGSLFDSAVGMTPFGGLGQREFPAINLWEDELNLFAEAELPGLSMENVEVLAQANELTVRGERKDPENQGASYHRRERGVGSFHRVVELPVDVQADKVSATLRDGVLTITMPKAEAALPRKIKVNG